MNCNNAKRTYIHVDIPAQMHISTFGDVYIPIYGFSISMMLSITSWAARMAAMDNFESAGYR